MSWTEDTSVDGTSRTVNEEELFVFGYGCKIFRDDEKAEWIDEGKHLIPWMGDGELLIDRYDGRGALMDLKFYEPREDQDTSEDLDPDEAYIEKLCDEERYRELNEDEDYETSYQEAEFKRLQMAVNEMSGGGDVTNNINNSSNSGGGKEYGSVGYTYSDNVIPVGPVPKQIKNELPYTPPPDLAIPPEILHPLTMKSHAIIEKTAKFIASHGTQMEIILKTKQSKNPQFDFLSHNDPLNPYYKFLVYAIKSNMYKPPDVYHDSSESGSENDENSSDDEDGYLHPSLVKKTSDINKFIPKVNLKPSSDCAYSMLVSRIKEASSDNSSSSSNTKSFPQDQQQQQQYQQPNQPGLTSDINPNYSTYYNTGYPAITTQPVQHVNLMPNSQEQLIIEKMANYVVKNGPEFEVMAYQKCDPRFAFLETTHQHHWYYLQCKEKSNTEVKAVVASKSFVRYNENNPDTNTLQQQQQSNVPSTQYSSISASTQANTSPPPNDESQSSKNYASVIHKPRTTKDILQTTKVKNEKEKVIKFSSNLSNFATVLKQKEEEEEELEVIKSLDNIDNIEETLSKKDDSSNGVKDNKVDEDEVRRLKEERRKKAALFLQSLKLKKSQSLVQANMTLSSSTTVSVVPTTATPSDDVPSDVESIPSPTVVFKEQVQISKKSPKRETPNPNDLESDVTIIHQQKSESTIVKDLVYDRLKSTEDLKKSDKSNLNDKDKKDRHYSNSRNRSSRRSRSPRRRSRSSSGISDSRSSSRSTSSSSYSHKRKKSKRKHSKKSHKKRDRSRSKKSKKRRH